MKILKEKKLQESSFLVGVKTIQDIIELIDGNRKLSTNKLASLSHDKNIRDPFKALYALNALALVGRYGDDYDKLIAQMPKKMTYNGSSFVQKFKSLQCFLYQCSEDIADKELLFKFLLKIKEDIKDACGDFIEDTPEYNDAYWGD